MYVSNEVCLGNGHQAKRLERYETVFAIGDFSAVLATCLNMPLLISLMTPLRNT